MAEETEQRVVTVTVVVRLLQPRATAWLCLPPLLIPTGTQISFLPPFRAGIVTLTYPSGCDPAPLSLSFTQQSLTASLIVVTEAAPSSSVRSIVPRIRSREAYGQV